MLRKCFCKIWQAKRIGIKWTCLVLIALLGGLGASLAQVTTVTFSHANTEDGSITEVLSLADGEIFQVEITETNTAVFDYQVTGIRLIPSAPAASPTTKIITQEHSVKFGGYYVKVRLKKNKSHPKLKPKTWIISTRELGFHTDVNVGLMGTPLTDPKFFLEDDGGFKKVARDRDADDEVSFGFATFATVYHDRRPWLGGSLGLGISENNLSVMVGLTGRFQSRAAITAGYHWAQIDRLPTGVSVGEAFTGDSLTLSKHTRGDWFFAVSISGFTDVFEKKLAKDTIEKR